MRVDYARCRRGVCFSSCRVCAIKMCRVVPCAAAGEKVHALADCQLPFHLVGEQGKARIQVQVSLLSHTQTRLA